MNLISSKELSERSGATYRQIDYWCRTGVISPVGEACPGSGKKRRFEESLVGPATVLARVSHAFGHILGEGALKTIFDSYEKGAAKFNDGIILMWVKE